MALAGLHKTPKKFRTFKMLGVRIYEARSKYAKPEPWMKKLKANSKRLKGLYRAKTRAKK